MRGLATPLLEDLMGYSSHLGLLSEEISKSGQALGNLPQAFSHVALISKFSCEGDTCAQSASLTRPCATVRLLLQRQPPARHLLLNYIAFFSQPCQVHSITTGILLLATSSTESTDSRDETSGTLAAPRLHSAADWLE